MIEPECGPGPRSLIARPQDIGWFDSLTAASALVRQRCEPFVELTRPGVLALVVVTAAPVFVVNAAVWPGLAAAAGILLAITLAGASCSALNAVLERDLDARMKRTRSRPLPSGRLTPRAATIYGLTLGVLATALAGALGGGLAAAITFGSIVFYVGLYTGWLKRRTPQNIVIGGAAGAVAPLIADAALTGEVGPVAWLVFALIVLWTPPHFWAVALYRKGDYAAAGLPMMPLVVGEHGTRQRMLAYGVVSVAASLVAIPLGLAGWIFGVAAAVVGAWFLRDLIRTLIEADARSARRVFMTSNIWLLTVVVALCVDGLVSALSF